MTEELYKRNNYYIYIYAIGLDASWVYLLVLFYFII